VLDHQYIEEHNIADRYLMGKLDADEMERFENHFADCSQCRDTLEEIENFRSALRANRDLLLPARQRSGHGLLAVLRQSQAWRGAWATAVILMLAASLWLMRQNMQLRDDLESTRNLLTQLQEHGDLHQESPGNARQTGGAENLSAEHNPKPPEPVAPASAGQATRPLPAAQVNTPIFALSAPRADSRERINEIALRHSTRWFLISIDLESGLHYPAYRAVVRSADGRAIWTGDGLKANRFEALTMSFTSDFFPPGKYTLTIAGLQPHKAPMPLAVYPFHILKKSVK
jgi:anti-sigma factor RsiW